MPLLSKIFSTLFVAAFLTAGAAPVYAQTIDAAGADKVRDVVGEALAFYLRQPGNTGDGLTTGKIDVTPKTDYYEVKIPDVVLSSETGDLAVGTVMLNVTPEEDGDYRASIAVPPQMSMKDKNGAKRMTVALGKQQFSGIWRPALGLFTQAVGEYHDVAIDVIPAGDDAKGSVMTLSFGEIKSQIAMQPDGDFWSGPQSTSARNVGIVFGNQKENKVTLDTLDATATYKKLDLTVQKKLREELKRRKDSSNNQPLSPEDVRAIVRQSFGGLHAMPESVGTKINISGLLIDLAAQAEVAATADAPARPARGPFSLRLASGSNESMADGIKTDTGTATGMWKLRGLTLQGAEGPMAGAVPNEVALNISGAHLPFKSAIEALVNATDNALTAQSEAQSAAEAKAQSELYIQQALATLPKLMATAGTTLTISDTYSHAPDLSGNLDGNLKAVETSPYAFAGNMTLTLTGMDELIVKLQEMARTSTNPKAAGWAQMLILMQLSGQQDKTPEGKSRRTYALELTPEGGVRLNGADMGTMLQRAPSQPPSQTAPAPAPAPAPATP